MQKLKLMIVLAATGVTSLALAADKERRGPAAQLDTDGDGSISFAEFQSGDRDPLARMDNDANGVLTLDELLNARPDRRPPDADTATQSAEVEARRAERRAQMTERLTERFNAMDLNGDAIVSLDEFQESTFTMLDRNGDGLLNGRELRQLRRNGPGIGGGDRGRRPGGPRGQSAGQSDGA